MPMDGLRDKITTKDWELIQGEDYIAILYNWSTSLIIDSELKMNRMK